MARVRAEGSRRGGGGEIERQTIKKMRRTPQTIQLFEYVRAFTNTITPTHIHTHTDTNDPPTHTH